MDYKEKLKLAKEALESGSYDRNTIEYIFPELKENEYEKMKFLIKSCVCASNITPEGRKEIFAWLERQGDTDSQVILPTFTFDDILALQCCMEIVKKVQEDKDLYEKLNDLHSRVYDAYHLGMQNEPVEPEWCHHEVDLSNCSEEYRKAYYDGWNDCNMQHSQCKAESNDEDERIRKELIEQVAYITPNNDELDDELYTLPTYQQRIDKYRAWLEKQGEQKPYGQREQCFDCQSNYVCVCKGYCQMKRDEQSHNDKVKPKFKVGDWILIDIPCRIISINNDYENYIVQYCDDDKTHIMPKNFCEYHFHLWTIKDAKDGDVLHSIGCHGECIFIFNGLDKWRFDEPNGDRAVATGYCCLTISANNMEFGIQGPDCIEVDTVKPATQKQRNLLFRKMQEAGYVWDSENKEPKKIESKTLDADKVIEWIHENVNGFWDICCNPQNVINKFKKDFGL